MSSINPEQREGGRYVTIEKVQTQQGERLHIAASSTEQDIAIDALALESLTWQSPDQFAAWVREADRAAPSGEPAGSITEFDSITVSNEYAAVRVLGNGRLDPDHIRINSLTLGTSVELDLAALEWLSTQNHERFTEFLEYPFGPDVEY